jgi:membrane protein
LFGVIKDSLNQIWQVRVKESPGFLFLISNRARSFAAILLAGILFFADLLFESLERIAVNYIDEMWKGGGFYFKRVLGEMASVIVLAAWFILLFRFLADGKPSWKASLVGGILTGILFIAGRMVLRYLLINGNVGQLYGASGSFVLVLLFFFYSSFIFYYGACFIAVYSEKQQWKILPHDKAYSYRVEKMQ